LNKFIKTVFTITGCSDGSHLDFKDLSARKIIQTGLTGITEGKELNSLQDLIIEPVALAAVKIQFKA
jgi:hypothetical protein